jgi:hypothetical protein
MVDGRLALGRLCAVQGRHDEALQWWVQAREVLQAQQAATLLAIVDHDEAVVLAQRRRPGDTAFAEERFAAAGRQFAALGMSGWARRAAPPGTGFV